MNKKIPHETEGRNEEKDNDSTAYLANRLSGVPEITLIGEAVTMGSLAAFIEKKYQKPVRVICPLETHENLLATNDCTANGEEEMEKLQTLLWRILCIVRSARSRASFMSFRILHFPVGSS